MEDRQLVAERFSENFEDVPGVIGSENQHVGRLVEVVLPEHPVVDRMLDRFRRNTMFERRLPKR